MYVCGLALKLLFRSSWHVEAQQGAGCCVVSGADLFISVTMEHDEDN